MSSIRSVVVGFGVLTAGIVSQAADSAIELSRYLPGEANAVSVVRVAEILNSPRAKAEGWAETASEKFLTGASRIPPWVDTLVIGSLVRPELHEQVWSTAVLELPKSTTMESIARSEDSRVDRLAGLRSVRSRRDSILVEFRPRLLGVRSPGVRQEAARWARSAADGTTKQLPEFLRNAVANTADIVQAIDLNEAADIRGIRDYLEGSDLMPTDAVARVDLPMLLTSLRGVAFFVMIGEVTTAKVVIEFGEDASQLGEPVAAVFRRFINDMQMSIDEFEMATVTAQGKTVTLSMELSDESLRRVISLISTSHPSHKANEILSEAAPSEPPAPRSRTEPVAVDSSASRRYFRSVSQTIDDLARANVKAKDYARTATWHDNFARRIDELAVAGVDTQLIEFGRRVSDRFHALAASLRGQGVQVNTEQQTLVYDVDYRPGWAAASYWGVVGYGAPSVKVSSNLQQVRERQAAAVTQGSQQRIAIWNLITSDRSTVERLMREKYGDEFTQHRR
ncbi:MAG: hypothetical protein HQ518_26520 [Rhodopirellula sp.]|nr:hypothetical protein [Rhodopirellula sp.]